VGTTITAFLAALAAAALPTAGATAGVGLTVAIVHLLFNVFGIVLIYPVKFVPIFLARWLAHTMSASRRKAVLFLLCYFAVYLTPLAILLLL
jgi:sodium-dependent phosphate cotransporter